MLLDSALVMSDVTCSVFGGAPMIRYVLRTLGVILALGLLYAVLAVFGYDLFAIIGWGFQWFWSAVKHVGEWFLGNDTFRQAVTTQPS